MSRPIAKTARFSAYFTASKRAIQIQREGKIVAQIRTSDAAECSRLLAKVAGLVDIRKKVHLYGELEPPKDWK